METTIDRNDNRTVLGRGIGSLLPETNKRGFFMCPVGELYPNHAQPRKYFDQSKLEELAQSIREKGVLQPIIAKKTDKGYVIIAGERRWRASQIAGKKEVPVILKDLSDNEILETALIENVQREDLNPIEESESYQRLILDLGLTQEEISKRVGKDRTTIANALRLLKLSKEVREKIVTGELSVGHARCLISVEDKDLQNQVMNAVLEKGLSVRQLEAWVKKIKDSGEKTIEAAQNHEAAISLAFQDIQKRLEAKFSRKVEIKANQAGKGQIILHFSSQDEFNDLLAKIER